MQGLVLISAGFMLCCLGFLLSLPSTTSDGSSALAGAKVEHMERGADAPAPGPDGSYLLMSAEELQETDKLPVNAYLLTMLVLNARRRGALVCSVVDDDRGWLAVIPESLSFLGVFRL